MNFKTITTVASFCLVVCAWNARSVELMTKEDAVKRMFLTADKVTEEKMVLTDDQAAAVKKALGGKLYAIKKTDGVNENEYTFFIGTKAGKQTGIAVIEEEIDKWGPLQFIIVVDPTTGNVTNAAMMKYVDSRSRYLSERSFLKTFFGKGSADPLEVNNDINAVSGATVSTGVLCFIVKKVVALHNVLFLKK